MCCVSHYVFTAPSTVPPLFYVISRPSLPLRTSLVVPSVSLLFPSQHLVYRVDAFRLGMFFGGFSALYKGLLCGLRAALGEEPTWAPFAAGSLAGSVVLFLEPVRGGSAGKAP